MGSKAIVLVLAGALAGSLTAHYACASQERRAVKPGPCGERPPDIPRLNSMQERHGLVFCHLGAGHTGMHRDDVMGAVWGKRRVGWSGGPVRRGSPIVRVAR